MNKKYIIGIIVALVTVIIIANYQSIFKSIIPPKPVVVSSKAEDNSSLFEYSLKITGVVRNDGGDGYVVVKARVHQGVNEWEKTQQIYMDSYQTADFSIEFDEVKFLDSTPEYSVISQALGSL